MRRALLSLLIIGISITCFAQSGRNMICRLGFTYEMSKSPNWGNGKPVVKTVLPYSPAEQAGLKPFDLIEEIDGIPIASIAFEEIPMLLNPAGNNEVVIRVSNISDSSKRVLMTKDCKRSNAISEDQLATAYAMYSLESTSVREFICPFKTTVTTDPVDFAAFKTYAFEAIDENYRAIESVIHESIDKELEKKGLRKDANQADILVQTFYFFDRNSNYMGANKVLVNIEPTYRYDLTLNRMVKLPFLNYAAAEAEAEYILQLGFRLIDQKIQPGRVLWECEGNELMESSYRLEDYARIHIPLMCMQYPYVKYARNVKYSVDAKSYNYTGISYDIDRLELIAEVDRNSPAYAAGVRAGDVVDRIGRHKMNRTVEQFTAAYKRFITTTMSMRDPKTLFTDANGFQYCMYWDPLKYPMVADAIQKNEYMSAFSYLYNFAPYINPAGSNTCDFSIARGKKKMDVVIRPTIRAGVVMEIK